MENFYLIDFIKNNYKINSKVLDAIKYELDKSIYYYGNQFLDPKENGKLLKKSSIKRLIKLIITLYFAFINKKHSNKKTILSNAYFTVNDILRDNGFNVLDPPWSTKPSRRIMPDWKIYFKVYKISQALYNKAFIELLNKKFISGIEDFKLKLKSSLIESKVAAVIVPNDVSFFENIIIQVCKEIEIPSFVFLHGLPGRYNKIDENRTDYLMVWGNKIKENYIKAGFNNNKIIVTGHPNYSNFQRKHLKFSFDDILIITKAMNGAQHSDAVRLSDRGNIVLYLLSIEKILKKYNIKSVRFRPHPSENPKWYYQYIDKKFYRLDEEPLHVSLNKSTLIIGPTSTVFIESLHCGVNYLVYEPVINKKDLMNLPLVPPFDGSDKRVPVAFDEKMLEDIMKNKRSCELSVYDDYINNVFNIDVIKDLIK